MAVTKKPKEKASKIKFKYIFAEDYNAKYASGLYGGVTPSGDIVANFYFERHGLPVSQTHDITPGSQLGEIIENEPADLTQSMVRIVENGVILNVRVANQLIEWLSEQVKVAEKLIESQAKTNK